MDDYIRQIAPKDKITLVHWFPPEEVKAKLSPYLNAVTSEFWEYISTVCVTSEGKFAKDREDPVYIVWQDNTPHFITFGSMAARDKKMLVEQYGLTKYKPTVFCAGTLRRIPMK